MLYVSYAQFCSYFSISPLLEEHLTRMTLWRTIWDWSEARPQPDFYILGLCFCCQAALFIQPLEAPWNCINTLVHCYFIKLVLLCFQITMSFQITEFRSKYCLWALRLGFMEPIFNCESGAACLSWLSNSSFRERQGPPTGSSFQPKMDAWNKWDESPSRSFCCSPVIAEGVWATVLDYKPNIV